MTPLTMSAETCELCNAIHGRDPHFCAMAAITENVRSLRAKLAAAEAELAEMKDDNEFRAYRAMEEDA